jgi:hypothetical protein
MLASGYGSAAALHGGIFAFLNHDEGSEEHRSFARPRRTRHAQKDEGEKEWSGVGGAGRELQRASTVVARKMWPIRPSPLTETVTLDAVKSSEQR